MLTLTELTEFFGWMLVINVGLMILTVIALVVMRGRIIGIHSHMFGVSEAELPRLYFQYIAGYKIAVIVLNVVPYVALKLMG